MRFTLTIDCDNDAFGEYADEVSRILRHVAERLDGCMSEALIGPRSVSDMNGNRVGSWEFSQD